MAKKTKSSTKDFKDLEGYEDLFDESGTNPKAVEQRAETKIGQLRKTKYYTQFLVKRQIKSEKSDLENLNGIINELKCVLAEKDSPALKKLLSEKMTERRGIQKSIQAQHEMAGIMNKVLAEELGSHHRVLESVRKPAQKQAVRNLDLLPKYIG